MKIFAEMICNHPYLSAGIKSDETASFTGNDITIEVTGLTPFTAYSFAVTSENAVSSQATDVSRRTCPAIATTLEEGKLNELPNGGSVRNNVYKGMLINVWDTVTVLVCPQSSSFFHPSLSLSPRLV